MNKSVIGKSLFIFIVTVVSCVLLLFMMSCIPQDAIRTQAESSAKYFEEHTLFPYLMGNQFNLRQDNYADAILVNIMYHVGQNPDESLTRGNCHAVSSYTSYLWRGTGL